MVFTKKLTNLQIELIKLFEYQVEDRQLLEIKDLLARYFADEATKAMDNLWQENGLIKMKTNSLIVPLPAIVITS